MNSAGPSGDTILYAHAYEYEYAYEYVQHARLVFLAALYCT